MKRNILRSIRKWLYISLVFIFVYICYTHWSVITEALIEHYIILFKLSGLSMLSIYCQSINYIDMMKDNRRIDTRGIKVLGVYAMWAQSNLVNYVAPFQPGIMLRALYFKKYGIGFLETGLVSIRQSYISLILGVFILAIFLPVHTYEFYIAKGLVVFIFLSCVLTFFLSDVIVKLVTSKPRFEKIGRIISVVLEIPTLKQIFFILIQYIIIAYTYYLIFHSFDYHLTYEYSLLLSSATILTTLLSIFPNGLGIQEAIIGSVAYYIDSDTARYVAIPFMLRLSHVISCITIIALTSLRDVKIKHLK